MTLAGLQNYILDRGWYIIMMSLSVQHSVVESLSFNGKNIRAVHVPSLGECLVGIDVSREIGYVDENNGRRTIKRHIPQNYMIQLEDVKGIVKRHVQLHVTQDEAILLKEPGLYCFLLRCKMSVMKPFMEWTAETGLPQEIRRLASVIEEKDAALALLNDDLQDRDDQIEALEFTNEEERQTHQQQILKIN